jgi:hypothetical protein
VRTGGFGGWLLARSVRRNIVVHPELACLVLKSFSIGAGNLLAWFCRCVRKATLGRPPQQSFPRSVGVRTLIVRNPQGLSSLASAAMSVASKVSTLGETGGSRLDDIAASNLKTSRLRLRRRGHRLRNAGGPRLAEIEPACQQSGIPAGRADAFPVELVEPDAPEPVGPEVVEPTVVSGVLSDAEAPEEDVGFLSRIMLVLTSQHCFEVTP